MICISKKNDLKMIAKLSGLRFVMYSILIGGFFVFFPSFMKEHEFCTAVLIYVISPTSFGLIPSIQPLLHTGEDQKLVSNFTSFYLLIALTVFVLTALLIY